MDERSFQKHLNEIDERLHHIEKYMLWSSVVNTVRMLVIVVPVVLAVIYVPAFVRKYAPEISQYKVFLDQLTGKANHK